MSVYYRVRRVIVQQAIGGEIARAVPDLARLARCSERSVKYVLSALREEEELVLLAASRQHYPARYRLGRTLLIEFESRSSRGHLGVVPAGQPVGQTAPLAAVQPWGGYRGGRKRTTYVPAPCRRSSRADGTNPRATAAAKAERRRHPAAFTACPEHFVERNGLGICPCCRAETLAGAG